MTAWQVVLKVVVNMLRKTWLKLNPSKTNVLCLVRRTIGVDQRLATLGGLVLEPKQSVKRLVTVLVTSIRMEAQISAAAKTAFFHLK